MGGWLVGRTMLPFNANLQDVQMVFYVLHMTFWIVFPLVITFPVVLNVDKSDYVTVYCLWRSQSCNKNDIFYVILYYL
jgi:hypothetical protein